MKSRQGLPIPFLVLILAGVISLASVLLGRNSTAGTVKHDSLQMQTMEQERMAALYFRILSWLSDVTPGAKTPGKVTAPTPSTPHIIKAPPSRHEHAGRVEFCAFHSAHNFAAAIRRQLSSN